MPSSYANELAALCGHNEYESGCSSCGLHDAYKSRDAAKAEREKFEALIKVNDEVIRNSKPTEAAAAARAQEESSKATERKEAWQQCENALDAAVGVLYARMAPFYDQVTGRERTKAFEAEAVEWQERCFAIWRNSGEVDWVKFVRADPTFVEECSVLDRSNIPATPDYLLQEPVGFGVFLQCGKAARRTQATAVGEEPVGVPIMNYGRAIREFGVPDAPGLDWREDGENVVGTMQPEPLDEIMARMQISTEQELRISRDPECQVTSSLTPAEQWAFFQPSKFGPDVINLASWYADLVAAKEAKLAAEAEKEKKAEEEKKNPPVKGAVIISYESQVTGKQPLFEASVGVHGFPGQSGAVPGHVGAASSGCPATATDSDPILRPADLEGWPEVEDLSFAGFTNWIKACKERQKKFGSETCTPWEKNRKMHLAQRMDEWSKTTTDGALESESEIRYPDPLSFYCQSDSLGVVDYERLGFSGKTKGKGKGKARE